MTDSNRQWQVARYPDPEELISDTHFDWTSEAIPQPAAGEFLVKTAYLTPIPAQRGYLDTNQSVLLGEQLPLGSIMRGRGIGEIIESRHPDYKPGEIFVGSLGWQDYSIQRPVGKEFIFSTRKIPNPQTPLSLHMGILGQVGKHQTDPIVRGIGAQYFPHCWLIAEIHGGKRAAYSDRKRIY